MDFASLKSERTAKIQREREVNANSLRCAPLRLRSDRSAAPTSTSESRAKLHFYLYEFDLDTFASVSDRARNPSDKFAAFVCEFCEKKERKSVLLCECVLRISQVEAKENRDPLIELECANLSRARFGWLSFLLL